MTDKKFTFFEFHFDGPLRIGPSFGDDPNPDVEATDGGEAHSAVSGDASPAVTVDPEDEGDEAGEDAGSGRPVKGAIVGFLLILALAIAARVLLGDDEDEVDDVEVVELDDANEEVDETAT